MSDSNGKTPITPPSPSSNFWRRLRARLTRGSDKGLRESLEGAIKIHAAQNPGEGVGKEAKSMMLNIIEFSDLRVDDAMVPRVDIVAIEDRASMRELMQRFIEAGHSRLPVYRDSLDEITGMVHVKDFMAWLMSKGGKRKNAKPGNTGLSIPASELSVTVRQSGLHREVLFVPPSMPAPDLLVKMQASHIHLAIVIDEYGGTDGLISIEDLMEEIVGDISDEHDTDEDDLIKPVGDGVFVADGRVDIEEFEELLNVDLLSDEDDEETDTLAGLVFKIAGRVPARGEIIRHASGLEFEVIESDPRRVKRLRITGNKPAEAETLIRPEQLTDRSDNAESEAPVPSSNYELFEQAMRTGKQVFCKYNGLARELCPIILGHTDGQEKALTYQVGGQSRPGSPQRDKWRCLFLSKVSDVQLRDGPCIVDTGHRKEQSCVKVVDLDVNPASPYNPKRRISP